MSTKEIWFGNKVSAVKKIAPKDLTFEQFVSYLRTSAEKIPLTVKEYDSLQKIEKNSYKDGRYFCATSFITASRRDTNCAMIQLICIDIDEHDHAITLLENLEKGALSGFNFITYSTMSSRPGALRYRLVVDADGAIPADYYPRCVASVGEMIGLKDITSESFTLSQPMFAPKCCNDVDVDFKTDYTGEPFTFNNIDFEIPIKNKLTRSDAEDLGDLAFLEQPMDIATEEIEEALSHLDADCGLKEWVRIAGSLKHQFQSDDEEAFRVFHDWSKTGSKYHSREDCLKTWKTIKANPDKKPSTIRTVLWLASEQGWKRESQTDGVYEEVRGMIEVNVTHASLTKDIPKRISQTNFPEEDHEALVHALQKKIKASLDFTYPIAKLRKLCRYVAEDDIYQTEEGVFVNEKQKCGSWTEGFCFLNSVGEYYNMTNHASYKPGSLDSIFSRFLMTKAQISVGEARPEVKPSDYLDNVVQVPHYEDVMYHPSEKEDFRFNSQRMLNSYRHTYPRGKVNPKRLEYISKNIEDHVRLLFRNERIENIFLDFLAKSVQDPGFKYTWCVLIQGTYGNGKSFFYNLMNTALGSSNVNTIDASILHSDFNEYAQGSQMVFIEEMRLHANAEHKVMSGLKTVISNPEVSINRKYRSGYTIPNVTNYVMFTNDKGAIQIDDSERRYFIISTQQQNKHHVRRDMPGEYFDELFGILEYPDECRQYLLNREIDPTLNFKGNAPETSFKNEFVAHSKTDLEIAVEDTIGDMDQSEVISSTQLFRTLKLDIEDKWGNLRLNNPKLSRVLLKMGYHSQQERFVIENEKNTLWVHETASPLAKSDPCGYMLDGGLGGL